MVSQLVFGSTIVTGGNALFDVSILRIVGISPELYKINDFATDVIVLKLCGSNSTEKLL